MKWFALMGLLACIACTQLGDFGEGLGNPVVATTTVYIGQGQSCISQDVDLRFAVKYPARLPKGVSIRTVSSSEYSLIANSDAPKNQLGLVSSGVRVVVSDPTATLTANCDTMTLPI
jgi:hypothetical protein